MILSISFCLTLAEKDVMFPIMQAAGWSIEETGWVSAAGERVHFFRNQQEIKDFPGADLHEVERLRHWEGGR